MSKLYLYNYNNYLNRIFKKENTLSAYGTPIYTLSATNFNYNDGVDTSHIVNYQNQDGDYLIITDDNDVIQSRWFVIENVRTRGGQHNLVLKRDLKVDLYELYKDVPMIIHRSWLNENNPLLFNIEGFNLNQIKKEEILLNDATTIPWFVVYFAKNTPIKQDITFANDSSVYISDIVNTPIAESIYASGNTEVFENINYIINAQQERFSGYFPTIKEIIKPNGANSLYSEENADYDYVWFEEAGSDIQIALDNEFNDKYSAIHLLDTEHTNPSGTDTKVQKLLEMNGKYVKDSLDKVYYITVSQSTLAKEEYTLNTNVTDYMKGRINTLPLTRTGDWGDEAFGITYNKTTYVVTATEYTQGTLQWTVDFAYKQQSIDGTFNVIAFPAKTAYATVSQGDYYMNEEIAQKFIASLVKEYGTEFIYDIQMLPYCPLQRAFDSFDDTYNAPVMYADSHTDVILSKEAYFYKPSNVSSLTPCVFFYYIKDTTFSFDINKSIQLDNYSNDESINIKLNNECNLFRIVSPNYNGQFEFSVAKNNGVDKFNVDVTLRPYNPYIHVNPNFKGLYGRDYDDSRGLICNGDFSIPLIKDAWVNYELQNKNYQSIFNRQIENMDFNFEQERIKGIFGAIAGSVAGGVGGAVGGAKIGGLAGGIIGGAVGGAASIAGGIIDYNMMTARQDEQRDYTIDNFKYQLGNIKALPYSITKVTPFTANNKIFPFVEKYTATDEEINIMANKLNYNSFTTEAIGNLNNHLADKGNNRRFFSATLIFIENANQPTHELQELAKELEKGVYI